MSLSFRDKKPSRTFTGTYSDYRKYKDPLRKDFNQRCGYTDCPDSWFGGKNTFHIDHFKSWRKHPNLKEAYSNLVYSCSYVNILKSDDDSGNYLDPCDEDFNNHFERTTDGEIRPKDTSPKANYMYRKLKLYLSRYKIIWMLEHLMSKMSEVKLAVDKTSDKTLRDKLLIVQGELANMFVQYWDYLKKEL